MTMETYLLIERILFWIAITVVSIDAYFIICHGGIPNIRTAPAIRKRVIELLKADASARNLDSYTIVDVGSGNGLLTREIATAMPQAKVIGIELAKQSVWWSNWFKRRQGLTNLDYKHLNFNAYNFAEADAVVMYMLPSVLITLGKKLNQEARPGTLITANRFPLGDGWQPTEKLHVKTRYFNQGDLYVYRKG